MPSKNAVRQIRRKQLQLNEVAVEATAEKPIPAEDIAAGTIKDSSPSSDAAETVFTGVETQLIEFLEMEVPLPAVQKMATNLGYEGDIEVLHQQHLASLQAEVEEAVAPIKEQLLELIEMGTPKVAIKTMASNLGYTGE